MSIFSYLARYILCFSIFSSVFLGLSGELQAFPNEEKVNLNLALAANANKIIVSPDDRFIVVDDDEEIVLIDTQDWAAANIQPADLDSGSSGFDFLPNNDSLYVYQDDGLVDRIIVDDPLNNLLEIDVSATTGTISGLLVTDYEEDSGYLYILTSDNTLHRYSIASHTITKSVALPDDLVATDMVYAGSAPDRIIITTTTGRVLFYDESLNNVNDLTISRTNALCTNAATKNLPALAVGPDDDLVYVLNSSDNTLHMVSISSAQEVNIASNPLCFVQPLDTDTDINTSLTDVYVQRVTNPSLHYGFVTGTSGVTVFNATNNAADFDFVDVDTSDNAIDNITTSFTPGQIVASSTSDAYVYTANNNGTVSVISDNPYVTISAITPSTVTNVAHSFTLTFQSDEVCAACAYRVRVNGTIAETGTALLTTTLGAAVADTDVTTAAIDINAFAESVFVEGTNTIFLFVDDAAGNTGRDSINLTVDRPPPDVTILSTSFGNQRAYLNISRLPQADISRYNIYVLAALDQVTPACPGGLDFSAVAATATVAQPGEGSNVEIVVSGLTNGTAYCFAVGAQDTGGNVSANRVVATTSVRPEVTVGIAGLSGEAGCSIGPRSESSTNRAMPVVLLMATMLLTLCLWRLRRFFVVKKRTMLGLLVLLTMLVGVPIDRAEAVEVTDQHWAFHFQGGFYYPTDSNNERLLGKWDTPIFHFTFGRLWDSKYEINLGVGVAIRDTNAVGVGSGLDSSDRFSFSILPVSNSFVYRGDFVENQLVVPYVGVGLDYLLFRENLQGVVTKGSKFGYHAFGGVQILLEFIEDLAVNLEEAGMNDIYFTLEGRWQQIDNFGGRGLTLNGFNFLAGLLFEF